MRPPTLAGCTSPAPTVSSPSPPTCEAGVASSSAPGVSRQRHVDINRSPPPPPSPLLLDFRTTLGEVQLPVLKCCVKTLLEMSLGIALTWARPFRSRRRDCSSWGLMKWPSVPPLDMLRSAKVTYGASELGRAAIITYGFLGCKVLLLPSRMRRMSCRSPTRPLFRWLPRA